MNQWLSTTGLLVDCLVEEQRLRMKDDDQKLVRGSAFAEDGSCVVESAQGKEKKRKGKERKGKDHTIRTALQPGRIMD